MRNRNDNFDFGRQMRRLLSDDKEMARFQRRMAHHCFKSDKKLLNDIGNVCGGVSHSEINRCRQNLEKLKGIQECDTHEMRERVRRVSKVLKNGNPSSNPNSGSRFNRGSDNGILRLLVLLFLLRGIRRRR